MKILCPKCGNLAYWDSYFNAYMCRYCHHREYKGGTTMTDGCGYESMDEYRRKEVRDQKRGGDGVSQGLLAEKCLLCNTGQEAMEQLGVMVFDAEGNMRANVDIVSDLEDALMKWMKWRERRKR